MCCSMLSDIGLENNMTLDTCFEFLESVTTPKYLIYQASVNILCLPHHGRDTYFEISGLRRPEPCTKEYHQFGNTDHIFTCMKTWLYPHVRILNGFYVRPGHFFWFKLILNIHVFYPPKTLYRYSCPLSIRL